MAAPINTIKNTPSQTQAGRLYYNRNEYIRYRYFGRTTNATATELFVDGELNHRLMLPTECTATVRVQYSGFNERNTVTNVRNSLSAGGMIAAVFKVDEAGVITKASADVAVMALTGNATPGFTQPVLGVNAGARALTLTVTGSADTLIHYEAIVEVSLASAPETQYGQS
jgi:hypothetical protein